MNVIQAIEYQYRGFFDGINGRIAEGWVHAPEDPDLKLTVEFHCDGRPLGSAVANVFREDLAAAGIGDGCHGFHFLLPLELFDGAAYLIQATVGEGAFRINNSPKLLCSKPLSSTQAFPADKTLVSGVAPLTDVQFVMLQNLHSVSEALVAQSQALAHLLQRSGAAPTLLPEPQQLHAQPAPNEAPSAPTSRDVYGPAVEEALRAPTGDHDLIVFSIIDWQFRYQRPQQIARRLAASGHRVFYLSVVIEECNQFGSQFHVKSTLDRNVFEVALHCTGPRPSIYAGFDDVRQLQELSIALCNMIRALGMKAPVGLVQFPSWYPIAASIPGMVLLHDCLDHVGGFNAVSPRVADMEELLIDQADAVVVTSEYLKSFVLTRRHDPVMIRNGVDVEYFLAAPPRRFLSPGEKPVIGYYGAISDWFDIDLIVDSATRHPEWRFVLIGSTVGCNISDALKLPNVELLGEKPYNELTGYLCDFDVCVIPFKLVDLIKATNPVKVYEYLCAGKPIVATRLPELELLPDKLVYLADTPEEFNAQIETALRNDSSAAANRRRQWALSHSWQERANRFFEVIEAQWPKVSVVVLCYNNWSFTRNCLSSIFKFSDYPNLEVIVVDNASSDETQIEMQNMLDERPAVRYIRNDENLGFAAGNNVGMRAATGEIVILLNNDTYVTRGWIRDLIRPLMRDKGVGLCGPLTNAIGNEQKVAINYANMDEMAIRSSEFTAARRRGRFQTDNLAFFCVAMRQDIIERVGHLDEVYQRGFFEDDDFCARVRTAGYRLLVCDDVFVHHHLSASFNQLGEEKQELMLRNKALYESRWGEWIPHRYRDEEGFGQ